MNDLNRTSDEKGVLSLGLYAGDHQIQISGPSTPASPETAPPFTNHSSIGISVLPAVDSKLPADCPRTSPELHPHKNGEVLNIVRGLVETASLIGGFSAPSPCLGQRGSQKPQISPTELSITRLCHMDSPKSGYNNRTTCKNLQI